MILPIGQLMMAEAAGPKRMGRVMSIVAVPAMLAPILGPTIGGLILDNASWRWIFYVNVPIGVIAVIAALRVLPRVQARAGRAPRLPRAGADGQRTAAAHLRAGRDRRDRQRRLGQGDHPLHRRAWRWWPRSPSTRCASPDRCSTCGCTAADVLVGVDRHVLPRRRAVRRHDPAAALLAGDPPRERRSTPAC